MENLKSYFDSLSRLSDEAWRDIIPLFKREQLPKNEYFAKEGLLARKIGFLESGVVRAYFVDRHGKEYNKQFFVGQSLIGAYSALLTGQPNLISQQALTDCVVYSCSHADLVALFDRHRDLERLARKIAESYFMEKERKELEIVLLDATQRYLLFKERFPTLEQYVPQYHIASYLGISATQLSRIRHRSARTK